MDCKIDHIESGTNAMWHHAHSQKHSTNSEFYSSEVDFNVAMRFNLNESGLQCPIVLNEISSETIV
jgi:hypothetical protein